MRRMAANRELKMIDADVSRAHFYATAFRPVFVKMPDEDFEDGDSERCGKLRVSIYGMKDAASNLSVECSDTLKASGYKKGIANPCISYHAEKDVAVMVQGDDFAVVGAEEHVADTGQTLGEKYKIKAQKIGGGPEDSNDIRVSNNILRCTKDGLELEADPHHAELVIPELRLESCKLCRFPGSKVDSVRRRDVEEEALAEAPLDDLEVEAGQEDTIRQTLIFRKSGGRVVAMRRPSRWRKLIGIWWR